MERNLQDVIQTLAERNDSFYLYDALRIRQQINRLKSCFPSIEFLYSVKCNPHREVLKTVFSEGLGVDAASLGEVRLAAETGLTKEENFYSAPGKTGAELAAALPLATVIADSLSEIRRISAMSPLPVCVGLRINPDFTMEGESGVASKFGVDEGLALEFIRNSLPDNIRISGIHVHLKSQELNPNRLAAYYGKIFALAERIESALGYPLEFLNMGSGIGIAYAEGEREIDLEDLGKETEAILLPYRSSHPNTRLFIESGRYIVCQSGVYVTHVSDVKLSHGKTYVILRNTLNGFARPSLGSLVAKYSRDATPLPSEPLYTGPASFTYSAPYPERETERVTLVGNLCTATDVMAENIELPRLEAGDIVLVSNAGAYGATLSPNRFSSQQAPAEYVLDETGRVR